MQVAMDAGGLVSCVEITNAQFWCLLMSFAVINFEPLGQRHGKRSKSLTSILDMQLQCKAKIHSKIKGLFSSSRKRKQAQVHETAEGPERPGNLTKVHGINAMVRGVLIDFEKI
jgi:hypothetical protein